MNGSNFRKPAHSLQTGIRQGSLVYYQPPPAVDPESDNVQRGIVISTDAFNNNGNQIVFVCPFFSRPTVEAEDESIPVHFTNGTFYLRPDLVTVVGTLQMQPATDVKTGRYLVVPKQTVLTAANGFLDIIRPTPARLAEPRTGFLGYGEIGWFDTFPREREPEVCDAAPVICLSPLEFRRHGIALFVRAYTNLCRYRPDKDVALIVPRYKPNFVPIDGVMALSTRRLSPHQLEGQRSVGLKAMRAFVKKVGGAFDDAVHAAVVRRYSCEKGKLPDFIMRSVKMPSAAGYGRAGGLQHFVR